MDYRWSAAGQAHNDQCVKLLLSSSRHPPHTHTLTHSHTREATTSTAHRSCRFTCPTGPRKKSVGSTDPPHPLLPPDTPTRHTRQVPLARAATPSRASRSLGHILTQAPRRPDVDRWPPARWRCARRPAGMSLTDTNARKSLPRTQTHKHAILYHLTSVSCAQPRCRKINMKYVGGESLGMRTTARHTKP